MVVASTNNKTLLFLYSSKYKLKICFANWKMSEMQKNTEIEQIVCTFFCIAYVLLVPIFQGKFSLPFRKDQSALGISFMQFVSFTKWVFWW